MKILLKVNYITIKTHIDGKNNLIKQLKEFLKFLKAITSTKSN